MSVVFEPVSSDARLRTLDVVRGAALLGIALMNIVFSGLPMAAYANPNLWGGNDPLNMSVLAVQWILFDGKMRALFSMMFGAGIILFMERALARDNSVRATDLLMRRLLWLTLFGAVHGWLIWAGDILYAYGLFGLLIIPMRNVSPKKLLITSGVAIVLLSLAIVGRGFSVRSTRNAGMEARAAEAKGRPLMKEQQEAQKAWDEAYNQALPSKEKLQEEVDNYRKGYGGVMTQRAPVMRKLNFTPVYFPPNIDIWALMLIGMALFKLGVLSAARSRTFYLCMGAAGFGAGTLSTSLALQRSFATGWDLLDFALVSQPLHYWGNLFMALGWIALVMLVCRRGWPLDFLAAVGRMALTNYLLQSVICTTIFYGHGLGLFGRIDRTGQLGIVIAIWIFEAAVSVAWLRYFAVGPLEWLTRWLVFKRRPSFLRPSPLVAEV